MICRSCNCWVPGKSFFCTCCGIAAGDQNSTSSPRWLLGLVLTLAVAACYFFVLHLANVTSAHRYLTLERRKHSGEPQQTSWNRRSDRPLSLTRHP